MYACACAYMYEVYVYVCMDLYMGVNNFILYLPWEKLTYISQKFVPPLTLVSLCKNCFPYNGMSLHQSM